jgi:two-component system nitrogen regulation response regulator GlnG
VGGRTPIKTNVRIVAATHRDLRSQIHQGLFREDLYYRLNVVRIKMPPLRERQEDIPQIVDFCLQNLVKQRKARSSKVAPEAMAVLTRYRWPGNVRELENVVYRSAVIAQGDTILVKDLPAEICEAVGFAGPAASAASATPAAPAPATPPAPPAAPAAPAVSEASTAPASPVPAAAEPAAEPPPAAAPWSVELALDFLHDALSGGPEPILARLEREMVVRVLKAENGNHARAAEKLGMTRATLRKRVDEWGLRI